MYSTKEFECFELFVNNLQVFVSSFTSSSKTIFVLVFKCYFLFTWILTFYLTIWSIRPTWCLNCTVNVCASYNDASLQRKVAVGEGIPTMRSPALLHLAYMCFLCLCVYFPATRAIWRTWCPMTEHVRSCSSFQKIIVTNIVLPDYILECDKGKRRPTLGFFKNIWKTFK